jgi:Leucine-rich repeat (LRR) protein
MNLNKEKLSDILKEKGDLNELSFVDLSNLDITSIEDKTFTEFTNLHQLIINEKQIFLLNDGLLYGPDLLNYLVIKKGLTFPTNDKDFCEKISSLTGISYLILSGNKIKDIEHDSFINLTNIRHLIISNNNITKIEYNGFKSLVNLEELNIQK